MNMNLHARLPRWARTLILSALFAAACRLPAAVLNYNNLTIGPNGALVGSLGDVFNVRGNLINNSTLNTDWDTHLSQISFNAPGPHQLAWTGTEQGRGNAGFVNNFAVGIFVLPSGASLSTSGGGALYTRVLVLGDGISQLNSITGSPLNIHYNPGSPQNAYLSFQTYPLPNGSVLSPAAAPADFNPTWNGTTGNWTDASRWSGGVVPLNTSNSVTLYDATINGGTVTLDQSIGYIQKLTLGSGATLIGPHSVTPWDTFTWGTVGNNSPSTVSGGAIVNANGDMAIVGDSVRNLDNATINNHAGYVATWATGNSDINSSNNAVVNNYGSFVVQNNRSLGRNGGTGAFNNLGTFTKNIGTGTTSIGSANFTFNNTGSINVLTGTLEFDGPLVGPTTASISVAATGTMVIADNTTTFAGNITNAGPLNVGDAAGSAGSAVVRLQVNNQINNSSILTVKSDGLLDLNGLSESVGALVIASGNVSVGAGSLLPSSLSMTGGTISGTGSGKLQLSSDVAVVSDAGGNSATISSQVDLNGAVRTFTVNRGPGATDLVVSGNVFNGGLTKTGLGIMTLSGVSTYSGTTTVNAGTLAVSGALAAATAATVNSGGTFDISQSAGVTVGSIAGAGNFRLGGQTLIFGGLATDTLVSGLIGDGGLGGGTGGSIIKLGNGNTTFSGITSYTGTTAVEFGTVTISGAAFAGSATTVDAAAMMVFVSGATAGSGTLTSKGSASSAVNGGLILLTGNGTSATSGLFFNQPATMAGGRGGQTSFLAGATAGNGTFTNSGAAVSGASAPGSAQFSDSGTTAGNGVFLSNGGISSGGGGGQTVFNGGATGGSASITANGGTSPGAGGGQTVFNDGSIIGAAILFTNGGSNGGSGGLTETIGNVAGGTTAVVTNAGGTFDISQLSIAGITVGSIQGAGLFDLGGKILTIGPASSTTITTVSGPIVDGGIANGTGGSIIKIGSGTAAFSGTNTYSGGTTLNQGGLNINSPNAIGTGPFTVTGGTIDNTSAGPITLATNNVQSWAGSFTFTGTQSLNFGSGAVTLNSNPTVAISANTLTVGPIGSGTGNSLTKAGLGTLFVNGGATYSGTTAVSAGTMTISGGPFAGSSTMVSGAATLNFINGLIVGNGTFSDAGTVTSAVAGGLIQFAGNGTSAGQGTYTVNGGTGIVQNGGSGGNGATMIFNSGATGGQATIVVQGASSRYVVTSAQLLFNSGSTAGNAAITTGGGTDSGLGGPALGGLTLFSGTATAGAATLVTNAGTLSGLPGLTEFKDTANAGTAHSTINSGTFNKFLNLASAAGATITINGGGTADFENSATASSAMLTIASNGLATFINGASGGSATLMNTAGGQAQFHNTSTGGAATVTNMDQLGGVGTAYTRFYDTATAGSMTITNRGGQQQQGIHGGYAEFHNGSSAGSASIANLGATASNGAFGGEIDFYDSSDAGTSTAMPATLINGGGSGGSGPNGGVIQFFNASRAGTANITNNPATVSGGNNGGGYTYFNSGTSADHATITNNGAGVTSSAQTNAGHTVFFGTSSGGNATIINNGALTSTSQPGETDFYPGSTAGSAMITANGAGISGAAGGTVQFNSQQNGSQSDAGSSAITVNGGAVNGAKGGFVYFGSRSSAANAVITTNGASASGALAGMTEIQLGSAGGATLISNGGTNGGPGGITQFQGYFGIPPDGGTARIIANTGGIFEATGFAALTVGSIEGAGRFQLGSVILSSGILNTDTTVSGLIVDGGTFGGSAAGLTKLGAGKLTLTAANTYTGATTAGGGLLSTNLLPNGGIAGGIGMSTSAAANLVFNGGSLQYTGPGGSTNRLYTLGTNGGGIDSSGSGPITFNNPGPMAFTGTGPRNFILSGSNTGANSLAQVIIDGPGGTTSLVKSGAGAWVLNNVNAYTGSTTITAGTLRYGGSDGAPLANAQAYTLSPANPVGGQLVNGCLGIDFNVNSSISVTQLGIYDDGRNGLANSHNVYIYNRATQTALATLNFAAGNTGALSADGYRFLALATPLALAAGNYSIVVDYLAGTTDRDFNSGASVGITNDGGGAVSFVGSGRSGSAGSFPTGLDSGPAYRYGAGSFIFDANAAGRIPGDVAVNGPTAVLDLGNNQNGNVATVTLDGGGSIVGTGTSRLTSRSSFQMKSGTVTAILAGAGVPLAKTTTGSVTLLGANTYSGNTTVSAGTLRFSITSGTPTIASGVIATVAPGATLELAGSISALGTATGNREHVVNNSLGATDQSAGLVVSGIHQVVGAIDGSGTTSVASGCDLRADHIVQAALIIGGTSLTPATVTIDSSDASGNPLSQSSGFALADSLTPSDPFDTIAPSSWDSPVSSGSSTIPSILGGSNLSANASAVPEPSTLLLTLFAALGVVSTQLARHRLRSQTVSSVSPRPRRSAFGSLNRPSTLHSRHQSWTLRSVRPT